MTAVSRRKTPWAAMIRPVGLCLAFVLIVACAAPRSRSSSVGYEGSPAAATTLADRLFSGPDEKLFFEGLVHLGTSGSGEAADYERAKEIFTAVVQSYPKSKWANPAEKCLRLIEERTKTLEKIAGEKKLIDSLRQDKQEALQNVENLKSANEKLQAEAGRLLQENEQLKKDIQLLKELEIQLDKRDRMLK